MKRLSVFLLVVFLALNGCTQVDKTAEANMATAQKYVAEVWNSGNLDLIDDLVTADFVRHLPESWEPQVIEGPEAFKSYIKGIREQYTDFHVKTHKVIASGDMTASAWTVSGTSDAARISVRGMSMARYSDGKLAEEWATWDTQGLMQQVQGGEEMSMKQ